MPPQLSLLGGAVLEDRAGGTPLPFDRRGYLLAYLAYDGGWVDRDRLTGLFWPDADERSAKRNLRQLLLRTKALGLEPMVEVTPRLLRWPVETDVQAFRRAVAAADTATAVDVYRGPLLQGATPGDSLGLEAWLESERSALQAAFHNACLREAEAATAVGRFEYAAALLSRLHEVDPLAEDVVEAGMRALYLSGRRDSALSLYESFAATLRAELGFEPLASTRRLLEHIRDARPLGVERQAPAATSEPQRLLHPSALVGRDRERSLVLTAPTPAVVLAGEPGVGKSALLRELYPEALRAGAREGLEGLPYHPLVELLRTRPELADAAGPYRADLARLMPELAPADSLPPLDPDTARSRVVEALARSLAAAEVPLVLDDLQWADPATVECFVYLASSGLKVLGAYRDTEAGPALARALEALSGRGELTVVKVEPLSEDGVRALVADLMHRDEGPALFSQRLWQRAGGNPLFTLETVKALFDTGALRSDASGWHTDVDEITVDYSELDVPEAVSSVIRRRLERLAEADVRVLEVMAVGRTALDAASLAKVTGLSAAAVALALERVERAGFVTGGGFRHDLLREAVAGALSPGRRRLTHSLLARELAKKAEPGVLAEHWWEAGELGEARRQWLEQVRRMRLRGLHLAALEVLGGALARLPDGRDARWLRLAAAETTLEGGWLQRVPALLDEVAPEAGDEPELHAKLALARSIWLLNSGKAAQAEAHMASQRHWFALVSDADLGLELTMFDARLANERGELDEAVALIAPAVERLRRRRPDARRVLFVTSLAALLDQLHRHEEALALHQEALALARTLGSSYLVAEASVNLLFCLADLGRHEEGIAVGEAALAEATSDNEPLVRINLASHYASAGRLEDALAHYTRLVEDDAPPHLRAVSLARAATMAARLGDAARATETLDALLDCLLETDYRVAHGAAAVALERYGSEAQLSRWRQLLPDLDPAELPDYLRNELNEARRERRGPGPGEPRAAAE